MNDEIVVDLGEVSEETRGVEGEGIEFPDNKKPE